MWPMGVTSVDMKFVTVAVDIQTNCLCFSAPFLPQLVALDRRVQVPVGASEKQVARIVLITTVVTPMKIKSQLN